jgi:hypothetical protein
LWNCTEHLLWFVVDLNKAKFHPLTYPDTEKKRTEYAGVRNVGSDGIASVSKYSIDGEYRRIFSHLEEQKTMRIIRTAAQKNRAVYDIYEEGHPAIMSPYLPVVPILMTTDETDVVFDPFAGTNVVGRMSILLNRQALSAELSQRYYNIGCKMLESGRAAFDQNSLKHISNEVYKNNEEYKNKSKTQIRLATMNDNLILKYHENKNCYEFNSNGNIWN